MSGYDICVIGSSWGGLQALEVILGALPASLDFAIAIVQHRSPDAPDSGLPSYYEKRTSLQVQSVEDKDEIQPGRVYIAPPDYHLIVEPGAFSLSVDDAVQFSRPSIDVLFETAADTYRARTIGVLLTGANEDGVSGLLRIKQAGGLTLVQDPETAARSTMPQAAIRSGAAREVLGLEDIAAKLVAMGAMGASA